MLAQAVSIRSKKISISKIIDDLMKIKLCEATVFKLVVGLLMFQFYLYDFNIQEYIR